MDVSSIARLAAFKIAVPRLATIFFDELAMFVEFDDCLQRHLNRLSPALRLQDLPGVSYKPLVQPERYQWLCHITTLLRVYTTHHYCNTGQQGLPYGKYLFKSNQMLLRLNIAREG